MKVQRAATRWVAGLRYLGYEETLDILQLPIVQERRNRSDISCITNMLKIKLTLMSVQYQDSDLQNTTIYYIRND